MRFKQNAEYKIQTKYKIQSTHNIKYNTQIKFAKGQSKPGNSNILIYIWEMIYVEYLAKIQIQIQKQNTNRNYNTAGHPISWERI